MSNEFRGRMGLLKNKNKIMRVLPEIPTAAFLSVYHKGLADICASLFVLGWLVLGNQCHNAFCTPENLSFLNSWDSATCPCDPVLSFHWPVSEKGQCVNTATLKTVVFVYFSHLHLKHGITLFVLKSSGQFQWTEDFKTDIIDQLLEVDSNGVLDSFANN